MYIINPVLIEQYLIILVRKDQNLNFDVFILRSTRTSGIAWSNIALLGGTYMLFFTVSMICCKNGTTSETIMTTKAIKTHNIIN